MTALFLACVFFWIASIHLGLKFSQEDGLTSSRVLRVAFLLCLVFCLICWIALLGWIGYSGITKLISFLS